MQTKQDIIDKLDDILWDLHNIVDNIDDLEREVKIEYSDPKMIYDFEKFIRELKSQNLYTKELEEFIGNYMQFDNTIVG